MWFKDILFKKVFVTFTYVNINLFKVTNVFGIFNTLQITHRLPVSFNLIISDKLRFLRRGLLPRIQGFDQKVRENHFLIMKLLKIFQQTV